MMRQLSRIANTSGVLLVMLGITFGFGMPSPATYAQTLPPRPTDTASPTATPATPTPQAGGETQGAAAAPAGRITGTVIDTTSGAPAPGITVAVGDMTVVTDANGNYNRTGMVGGSYQVALMLTAPATPAQDVITVQLAPDATVVQHLFFRSQPMASPTPEPVLAVEPAALPPTGGPADTTWMLVLLGMMLLVAGSWMRGWSGVVR